MSTSTENVLKQLDKRASSIVDTTSHYLTKRSTTITKYAEFYEVSVSDLRRIHADARLVLADIRKHQAEALGLPATAAELKS